MQGFYYIMIGFLGIFLSCLNPGVKGTIKDMLGSKKSDKVQKLAKSSIATIVAILIVCILFSIDALIIYDYIAIVALIILVIFKAIKKNIESFFYDGAKIYLFIYAIVRLFFLITEKAI